MPDFSNPRFGLEPCSWDDDPLDPSAELSADDLLIESYLDDELSQHERHRFETRLSDEPALGHELAIARSIREGLRQLPAMECPERVHRAVIEHAESHPSWTERLGAWFGAVLLRPAVPTFAALGLAVAVSWQLLDDAALRPVDPGAPAAHATPTLRAPSPEASPAPAADAADAADVADAAASTVPIADASNARGTIADRTVSTDDRAIERVAARRSVPSPKPSSVERRPPAAEAPAAAPTGAPTGASPTGDFSAAEVARAEQDVKLALAYLGQLGRTADSSVRQLTLGKWMGEALPDADGRAGAGSEAGKNETRTPEIDESAVPRS